MRELIKTLQAQFPAIKFVPGRQFCWSPVKQEVIYKVGARGQAAKWSLLHETGHALLDHTTYHADVELLCLEVTAWKAARDLAQQVNLPIDEDHIQDCLDTYRDWLHRRSICPDCSSKCLQQADFVHYRCFNCHKVWRVSGNRFGRSYRQTKRISAETKILFT